MKEWIIAALILFGASAAQAQTCPYSTPRIKEIQVTNYFASLGSQMVWPAESIMIEGPEPFPDPAVADPNNFIASMSCGSPIVPDGPLMTKVVTADKSGEWEVSQRLGADGCYHALYHSHAIKDQAEVNGNVIAVTQPGHGVYPVGNEASFQIFDADGESSAPTSTAACFRTNRGSQCQCGVSGSPACTTD